MVTLALTGSALGAQRTVGVAIIAAYMLLVKSCRFSREVWRVAISGDWRD
jgi:hypothetical protein